MLTHGIGAVVASKNVNAINQVAARYPTDDSKPPLSSIEQDYQVAEEATAKWSPKLFGFIPIGTIGGERELTITEGQLLDNLTRDRGIMGLQTFRDIADQSFSVADARVPPATTLPAHIERQITEQVAHLPADQRDAEASRIRENLLESWPRNDGHNDAFRHAYWNARLTAEFGAEWTEQFTTAHEGVNPGSSTREAMDLYNNEVGRQIAIDNPDASPDELADLVMQALNEGDLVVVGSDGHLAWSDTVARGNHGVSIDLNAVADNIATPDGGASAN